MALQPTLGTLIGRFLVDVRRAHGIDFVSGRRVTAVRCTSSARGVVVDDGQKLPADEVVVGIGALPETNLFDSGLLAPGGGVRVDPQMRTRDPRVFAAGDIPTIDNPLYGVALRSEHWTDALMGGRIAARSMLELESKSDPLPYAAFDLVPFIFTDQYDLFVEYAGWLAPGSRADVVIRGDFQSRAFQAFWLEGTRVVAAMHVNRRDEGMKPLRVLIRKSGPVDRRLLADSSVPLADLLD